MLSLNICYFFVKEPSTIDKQAPEGKINPSNKPRKPPK